MRAELIISEYDGDMMFSREIDIPFFPQVGDQFIICKCCINRVQESYWHVEKGLAEVSLESVDGFDNTEKCREHYLRAGFTEIVTKHNSPRG